MNVWKGETSECTRLLKNWILRIDNTLCHRFVKPTPQRIYARAVYSTCTLRTDLVVVLSVRNGVPGYTACVWDAMAAMLMIVLLGLPTWCSFLHEVTSIEHPR